MRWKGTTMAIFTHHNGIAIHGLGFDIIPNNATLDEIDAIIASTSEAFKAWHNGQWVRGETIPELIMALDIEGNDNDAQ